uniref:WD40 repeat domain-containing protein n=1 Tax=Streptomyces shenzhenensis TaxID=943815 RepID=UPI0038D4FD48
RARVTGRDVTGAAMRAVMSSGLSGWSAVPPAAPRPGLPLTEGRETYDVALSTDGRRLAMGGASGTVTVWDPTTADGPVAVIPGPPATTGCVSCTRITALAFSADATTLAVAYGSGTLRLWDLTMDRPLGGSRTTPGDVIDSLAFGPGGYLYAAGPHVSVHAYAVGPEQVAAQLCARAGRSLSGTEWRRYLPGVPYRRVCDGPAPDDGPSLVTAVPGTRLAATGTGPVEPGTGPAQPVRTSPAADRRPAPIPDPRRRHRPRSETEHRADPRRADPRTSGPRRTDPRRTATAPAPTVPQGKDPARGNPPGKNQAGKNLVGHSQATGNPQAE